MSGSPLTLVSHVLCPYVQRAAIALSEKGIAHDRRDIDLSRKPDWFSAISPLGKVPLLLVTQPDGTQAVVFESMVICEYIEETRPDPPLHPDDPLTKARHRGWIEFGSSILADLWGFETAKDVGPYETKRRGLTDKFARIEAELGEGPFFAGPRFSLVDAVFAPIFRYFDVFDAIAPTGVLDGLPRTRAWRRALAARPSVQGAVTAAYPDHLEAFLKKQDAWLLKRVA
ncbi:glutathione S-transferase family protein [Methylobacterium sp. 17Sr1-1]|uniref:glutathione S-transferase family protein n=1 Tax=Methylobacterium sp. 17Sr1-1 TaxID=2202826 RepID=UPI000D6F5BAD|nr:glutathione S-transferase family protein [Methylobacterium sp. 17Sr1-1]AWN51285.1 glutathione S-transferase family protein [Methylobacterium sp. 17Sr1-1]